jgi:cell division transport system permease protein
MFKSRSDLPLDSDANSRFLPWIVALMVFLSVIALAGLMVINGLLNRWEKDVTGTLTVQIIPLTGVPNAGRLSQERVEKSLALLQAMPGVISAYAISREQALAMLEPWLGRSELLNDLPLPTLIDVTIKGDAGIDVTSLAAQLDASIQGGVSIEDHRVWLSKILRLARAIGVVAASVLVLIGVATAGTVIYATRTGLAVHQEVIEVLHLIGAQDDYIARQFANRAMGMGFKGGIFGLLLALPTLSGIAWTAKRVEGGMLPELWLSPAHWTAIFLLPVIAALLAMITARVTVHRSLSRMG